MAEGLSWRDEAKGYYRVIFGTLSELPAPTTMHGAYLIDELRDALFDLKQAFIEDNEGFARRATLEIHDLFDAIWELIEKEQL